MAAFLVLFAPLLHAQQNQPIYPAYDGFLKNPDSSYTLAFAYFSHNANAVTIAPGANNSFAPTPGDRMQPTTFKPGHWRFQCVMVVGPGICQGKAGRRSARRARGTLEKWPDPRTSRFAVV